MTIAEFLLYSGLVAWFSVTAATLIWASETIAAKYKRDRAGTLVECPDCKACLRVVGGGVEFIHHAA